MFKKISPALLLCVFMIGVAQAQNPEFSSDKFWVTATVADVEESLKLVLMLML